MKSNISNTWTTILVTAITAAALTIAAEAQIYLSHSVTGVGRYNVYSGAEDGGWPWWTMSTPSAIFVSGSDLFIADRSSSSVYKYDANTGTNTGSGSVSGVGGSFISDPTLFPSALAMIGNNLLVGDELSGTIRKYNASTGDLVDGAFITDLAPTGMGFALNGSDLFVISDTGHTIGKFNAITGDPINSSFITGLHCEGYQQSLAISGSSLFVLNPDSVAKYDAATGALIDSSFITTGPGLLTSGAIASSEGSLFLLRSAFDENSSHDCYVAVYDAESGLVTNPSLISGLVRGSPSAITVVPEPTSAALLLGGGALLALRRRRSPAGA